MKEKILTQDEVVKLGLDKVQVITADMLDGYTSIGPLAFEHCYNLTSVTISNSITSIGKQAFDECIGLTSVTIGNSVTSIGVGAFEFCINLVSITIPNSIISIEECAFWGCNSLTFVTIPNSVINIKKFAFANCSGLTSIDIASDNSNYCSVDGVLFNKDKTTLIQYPEGKQGAYTIPNSVTSIGEGAFYNCSGLSFVTIPNSVTSIGDNAFENCDGLTSIDIPNSVISIGFWAFALCLGLTSVTIPNSVTSIDSSAFRGCTGLTSITIPNSITYIGSGAFSNYSSLTSVTIGNKTYKSQTVTNGKCKAYKAFNADMTCRDFQYKEGKTYELDEKPILCKKGFHACLSFLDVFNYYDGKLGKDIVIHEVKLEGVSNERYNNSSKVVAKKITIGKRIL